MTQTDNANTGNDSVTAVTGNTSTGNTDMGKDSSTGNTDTGKDSSTGNTDTGKDSSTGNTDTGKDSSTGNTDTGKDSGTAVTGNTSTGKAPSNADTGNNEPTTDTGNAPGGLTPLTPRPAPRSRKKRRWAAGLIVAAVMVAVALLVGNLLGDAALFFYNADEAVERRSELGTQRFRVQGTPLAEPVATFRDDRPALAFSIGFNDAVIDVVHIGDPPDLFQPDVPVVLEGAWQPMSSPVPSNTENSWHFASDRMLVKHDNDYRNSDDYDERINQARQSTATP